MLEKLAPNSETGATSRIKINACIEEVNNLLATLTAQLDEKDISNNTLTGASFIHEIGIWDETYTYDIDDEVIWNSKRYRCTTTTATATEGDISNRPDLSTDWEEITQTILPNTFASCTNGVEQLVNNIEVPIILTNGISTPQVTIDENNRKIIINQDAVYNITQKINIANASNSRQNPTAYLKINNSIVDITKLYGYSRNNLKGKTSVYMSYTRLLSAGDELQFVVINSTINNIKVISSESYFQIEYIPNAVI